MNITFMIGNGFDLNLGMKSSYQDFYEYYCKQYTDIEHIQNFKNDILNNYETWADAELGLAKYTENFNVGEEELFLDCHEDFCNLLAKYLQDETRYLKLGQLTNGSISVDNLFHITQLVKELENYLAEKLSSVYNNNRKMFDYNYKNNINFINFNYTDSLRMILSLSNSYRDSDIISIHGTVERNMALGVDNENQIGNYALFKNKQRAFDAQFIKPKISKINQKQVDDKAIEILLKSDLIYIYGMSLGETDKRWWDLIKGTLNRIQETQIIIHQHKLPEKEVVIPRKYHNAVHNIKSKIFGEDYTNSDRVHIIGYNIFDPIKDLYKGKGGKSNILYLEPLDFSKMPAVPNIPFNPKDPK